MNRETMDQVLATLSRNPIATLDITGGAPELNPLFRSLIQETRRLGRQVIVRTNLSVLLEPGMDDLPELYDRQEVELIASLPCYLEENVDGVRGTGTYEKCIQALRILNARGYGQREDRKLNLVYNPAGPFLPPAQALLEQDYRRELLSRHGISFSRLYTFANMPIGRFRDVLVRTGDMDAYRNMLACSFNALTLDNIMCRHLISVGWDGRLFDCDFNQVQGMEITASTSAHIRDFDLSVLSRRTITVDDHCFACTAGAGSS